MSGVSFAVALLVPSNHRSELPAAGVNVARDEALARVAFQPARTRAHYRYSVIPRGVFSAQELTGAINADPVVAAHYQTFDAARATLAALDHTRLAYVSYRLRDRVFWTRHPVRLPAGELVLTDGRDMVRARCGNRISAVPGETAPDEPDPILLDTPIENDPPANDPVAAPSELAGVPVLLLSPPLVVGVGAGASSVVESGQPVVQSTRTDDPGPPESGPPIIVTPPGGPRVRSVPEPSSVLLIGAGLIGLIRRRLAARRNA